MSGTPRPGAAVRSDRRSWTPAFALLAVLAGERPAGAAGLEPPDANRAAVLADEPLLFLAELVVDGRSLADALPVYDANGTYYIALASFFEAVEFPIHSEGDAWLGWWISPESAFSWRPEPPVAGTRPSWIGSEDGTAVSLERLESWFAFDLDFDPRRQRIRLKSSRPLPVQQREERAARRARGLQVTEQVPAIPVPDRYQHVTDPLVDLGVHALVQGRGGKRSDSQSVSVDLGMDLLKHSLVYDGRASRSSGGEKEVNHRLTFYRTAPTADGALGVGITGYELGDVFSTASNLVDGGGRGAGVIVERRRRPGRDASFATTTVEGDGAPGWDVELFRNGRLVGFGVVGDDGRWVFENVDTVPGENVFVARLHGPRGEADEQRQVVWGGGASLARGDGEFRFTHVDFEREVLGGLRDEDEFLPARRLTDLRGVYAITDRLQAGAAWSRAEISAREDSSDTASSDYASLFARLGVGRGVLLAEAVSQLDAGSAWSLEYLGTLAGHDIRVSHEQRNDFESPRTRRVAPLRSRSGVTVAGRLRGLGFEHYLVRATHEVPESAGDRLAIFSRLGGRWGAVAVANDLEWRSHSGGDSVRGQFRASGRLARVGLRTALDYDLTEDEPLRQHSTTVRWRPRRRLHASTTLRANLANGDEYWLEGLLSARHRGIDYTVRASAGSEGDWSLGLTALFHLGRTLPGKGWLMDGQGVSRSGRVVLAPFLDANGNGRRDAGERPVHEASYKDAAAAEGAPELVPLPPVHAGTPFDIETKHLDLPDPFLVPAAERYQVYTHAGGRLQLELPVLETVDLGGRLALSDDVRPAEFAVSLRREGRTVATARPERDGYFLLEGVPAGSYELEVRELASGTVKAVQRIELAAEDGFVMAPLVRLAAAGQEASRGVVAAEAGQGALTAGDSEDDGPTRWDRRTESGGRGLPASR